MQVDADDDSITRYIVQHYRYDDVRHERRWLTVAAFDNELEFEAYLDEAVARLTAAKQSPGADKNETIRGVELRAGYKQRARSQRTLERLIEHGGAGADRADRRCGCPSQSSADRELGTRNGDVGALRGHVPDVGRVAGRIGDGPLSRGNGWTRLSTSIASSLTRSIPWANASVGKLPAGNLATSP